MSQQIPSEGLLKKRCVLCSGGLDSAVLLHQALQESSRVFPLYVASGYLWEEMEIYWLQKLLQRLASPALEPLAVHRVNLQDLFPNHWAFDADRIPGRQSDDREVSLPGRNLILLNQAALLCQAQNLEEIWIGSLRGNPFSDASPEFFGAVEKALQIGLEKSIKIRAPFLHLKKDEIMLQYPHIPWNLTFTCLNPQGDSHCGNCNKCEERKKHFQKADLADPTNYYATL